ncbi:MAG: helix-turn-helix domain-containing protein [Oscillospiraceae bacterium]|nr:helix-turn-helix domain-containing protein [Oscillospiraceae bacterium]
MSAFTDNLRRLRNENGFSQKEVADRLGMTRQAYSLYETGKRRVDVENAKHLADIFGVTLNELGYADAPYPQYSGIAPVNTQRLPLLGRVACGKPIFDEITDTYIDAAADIKADFCLVCKGDSMINARIYDGDIVMIQRTDIVENGRIAAVAVGEEVTLKRVFYYPDKQFLELRAENPAFESLVFSNSELDDVRILGRAVAFTSLVR